MDPELRKAAINGDMDFVFDLQKDDPRLKMIFDCASFGVETPVHVALLHGRVEFATEILKLNPVLAKMPNERGSYPLHLASENGYIDVVREILRLNPVLAKMPNERGSYPVHLATENGYIDVVREILRLNPGLAKMPNERGSYPLHLASENGYIEVVREILRLNPVLAKIPNERGSYPLHLASERGYIDVVRELMHIDRSLYCLRDKEGRTALSSAALNEKDDVLELLYPAYIEQVRLREALSGDGNDGEELILHLCVEHNLFKAAQVLVKLDEELVKKRDDKGNTVLHLAAAKKNSEMLAFLSGKMQITDVKRKNKQGVTAEDIKNDRYAREKGRLHKFMSNSLGRFTSNSWDDWYEKDEKWTNEMHNTLILLATLIVTVAFQAGVNPPGGFWQEADENISPSPSSPPPKPAGTAIHNNVRKFRLFMYFDMIAFAASLTIILSLVSGFPLKHRFTTWLLVISVWIALTSMAMAFVFGTQLIIVNEEVLDKIPYVLGAWTILMAIVLLCHCVILVGVLVEKIELGGSWLLEKLECNNTSTPSERNALKKDEECGKQ